MTPNIREGPKTGRVWPAEDETYTDPTSGADVRRLTSHPGAGDWHLYFTEHGWYDDGRRLLFRSERDGTRQLYTIDLETGIIEQVTDLAGFGGENAVDHENELVYVWVDDSLVSVDLRSFRVNDVHYEVPAGYTPGSFDVNADGDTLYVAVMEEVRVGADEDSFRVKFEAEPYTKVLALPVDGGEPEVVRETNAWANSHVLASPTRAELFLYCEEGPWDEVDNRIWTVDAETGETWQVRDVPEEGGVGHEYWMTGERVGYHGAHRDVEGKAGVADPEPFAGSARYDDTDHREARLPSELYALTHTHAVSPDQIVCDGTFDRVTYGLIYQWDDDRGDYEGPRILATYDWYESGPHPHTRVSPDGEQVAFDSARYDGSSNMYLVDIPDFEDLPKYEERD